MLLASEAIARRKCPLAVNPSLTPQSRERFVRRVDACKAPHRAESEHDDAKVAAQATSGREDVVHQPAPTTGGGALIHLMQYDGSYW